MAEKGGSPSGAHGGGCGRAGVGALKEAVSLNGRIDVGGGQRDLKGGVAVPLAAYQKMGRGNTFGSERYELSN